MATTEKRRKRPHWLLEEMVAWKRRRFASGENPMDWVAFRHHLNERGDPDPGPSPPEQFFHWDETLVGGQPQAEEGIGAYSPSRDVPAREL